MSDLVIEARKDDTEAAAAAGIVRRRKVKPAAKPDQERRGHQKLDPALAKHSRPINLFAVQITMLEAITNGMAFHGIIKTASVSDLVRGLLTPEILQPLYDAYARKGA